MQAGYNSIARLFLCAVEINWCASTFFIDHLSGEPYYFVD